MYVNSLKFTRTLPLISRQWKVMSKGFISLFCDNIQRHHTLSSPSNAFISWLSSTSYSTSSSCCFRKDESNKNERKTSVPVNKNFKRRDQRLGQRGREISLNSVFVYSKNLDKDLLQKDLLQGFFTQFGTIDRVVVLPGHDTHLGDTYTSAWVTFMLRKSAESALVAKSIIINGFKVNIAKQMVRLETLDMIEKTYYVSDLPEDITIQQLRAYFQNFGRVDLVHLVVGHAKADSRIFAHVALQYPSSTILSQTHQINESLVTVNKSLKVIKKKGRSSRILVECLPSQTKQEDLFQHFEKFGAISRIMAIKPMLNHEFLAADISFEDTKSAELASDSLIQIFEKLWPVKVRLLGYCSDEYMSE